MQELKQEVHSATCEPTFSITTASHTLILAPSTTRPKLLYQLKLHTSKNVHCSQPCYLL